MKQHASLITCAQMQQRQTALGTAPRFERALPAELPVLQGHMGSYRLPGGLLLHMANVQDLVDVRSGNQLAAGIKATFLLAGETRIGYGSRAYHLQAERAGHSAALLALAEPDRFARQWRTGDSESKVCLTLTPDWIAQFAESDCSDWRALSGFSRRHMAERSWQPSRRARLLGMRLLRESMQGGLLAELNRESICNELALEVVQAVTAGDVAEQGPISPRCRRRVARLRELLDSGEADELGLQEIARRMACNPVDLQRQFRQVHGTTIIAYLRRKRLDDAYAALRCGCSVESAAAVAGYASPGNFATAFKRCFGMPPSLAVR